METVSFVNKLSGDMLTSSSCCKLESFRVLDVQGMWFSDVSIINHFGKEYTVSISMDNDHLVLAQSSTTFNVTGCPIGFGVKSVNFTCSLCDAFTYNIQENFVRECHSCDPEVNTGHVLL